MARVPQTPVSTARVSVVSPLARRTDPIHVGPCQGRRLLAVQMRQVILPGEQAEGARSPPSQEGRSRILVRPLEEGQGPHSPAEVPGSFGQAKSKDKSLPSLRHLAPAVAVPGPRVGKDMRWLIREPGS